MKSALLIASLAGGVVLASPVHQQLHKPFHKRGVEIEYQTQYVTVTMLGSPPSSTSEAGFQPHQQARPQAANVEVAQPEAFDAGQTFQGASNDEPASAQSTDRPAPSTGGTPSYGDDYQQKVIERHNLLRARHGAQPLVWDDQLAADARAAASLCDFNHNLMGTSAGQNIGLGHKAKDVDKWIQGMYDKEIVNYGNNYGKEPGFSDGTGHFTQLIWAGTHSCGCATVECPNGVTSSDGRYEPVLSVCNYMEAGNYEGQYAANVLAPL